MLAGNMKLKNFLLIAAVVGAAGIAGLYFACRGGDDSSDEQASRRYDPPRPRSKPSGPPAIEPDRAADGLASRPMRPDTPAIDPAAADTPAVTPPAAGADTKLRDVDRFLTAWAGKDLGTKKRKDVTKGRPYKVNLYQDEGVGSVNRAKVDLDRDDKWDEKWTFDGPNISRKVAPADDENYSQTSVWNGTEWVAE